MTETQHFELAVDWSVDSDGAISIPVPAPFAGELSGFDDVWSPEHLVLASLGLSFMATFYELARAKNLMPRQFVGTAEGLLERRDGKLAFSAFTLWLRLDVETSEKALAVELLEAARQSCAVSDDPDVPLDVFHQVRGWRNSARGETACTFRIRAPVPLPAEWSVRSAEDE